MDANDGPFETRLQLMNFNPNGVPESFKQAAIAVNDTLDVAWASARQVLGAKATPALALEICRMMLAENARLERVYRRAARS